MQTNVVLSVTQIATFLHDGVLMVDDILTPAELDNAHNGLRTSLLRHGVDTNNLLITGSNLAKLSSTNGSGGVIDLVYEEWKMDIALNEKLFQVTTELWKEAFRHNGESQNDIANEQEHYKWHPYGSFDYSQGYAYMDRVGYRLPTPLAEHLGEKCQSNCTKSNGKKRSLQRCLTPHLDCCPETFHAKNKTKWRPIQCMVALTDCLEPNTGGFEVAKGFHREFDQWAKSRSPSRVVKKNRDGRKEIVSIPAPCVGEYTHVRPLEDAAIMKRIQHVSVKAGSAVFWDNRLPHANAYRHNGSSPRCVVYCSFLPDVLVNRIFVKRQLSLWRNGLAPIDTKWMEANENNGAMFSSTDNLECYLKRLSTRQRRMLGVEEWSDDN
ncbi:hypothetical protein MPSEU_000478300 [Mayamaea pseudoterrestris]|nr:hypothetical protein MPSEU_000478300 [Mayamaea pseudoterrestris]